MKEIKNAPNGGHLRALCLAATIGLLCGRYLSCAGVQPCDPLVLTALGNRGVLHETRLPVFLDVGVIDCLHSTGKHGQRRIPSRLEEYVRVPDMGRDYGLAIGGDALLLEDLIKLDPE